MVLHKGHYSFTFKGHWLGPNATSTLGHVIVDFCKKPNPLQDERGAQIRQQLSALSTRDIFCFSLFDIHLWKKKELPIYTTEHCNNVVTLTKILGSWLSLCA